MQSTKRLAIVGVVLAGLAATTAAADTTSEAFFRPAPDLAQKYDPERIYPRGRIFPFSFYSVGGGSKDKRSELLPDERVQAVLKQVKQGFRFFLFLDQILLRCLWESALAV